MRIKITNNRAQILVMVPFLIVFMVGAILITIDIYFMSIERIHIQQVADIAARDGARMQALALHNISLMNTSLAPLFTAMTAQCVCRWPPMRWTKPCKGWVAAHKSAQGIIKAQNALKSSVPALVEAAVVKAAISNGAYATMTNNTSLYLRRTFALTDVYDSVINFTCMDLSGGAGFLLRGDIQFPLGSTGSCHLRERVDVTAFKNKGPAYGRNLLGKDLEFPYMAALSSARPYPLGTLTSNHPPRDDDLDGGIPAVNENYACMFVPGWWDARIVKYMKD